MTGLSAEDRALFDEQSMPLFEEIAERGYIEDDDPRIASDSPRRPAFDLLVELGLVREASDDGRWVPEDPSTVQSRVVAPLSLEGARLLSESSQWANSFSALSQAWRKSAAAETRGPFTYVHGKAIDPFIAGLVAECQEEVLSAQPLTGHARGALLERAIQTDRDLLKRGAKLRSLYQHAARRSEGSKQYVAAVSPLGGEVRTLDEFFNRMIVFDRRVAIIPSPEGTTVALAVREPSVVAYLVDVFDRHWERARPFTNQDSTVVKGIAAEQRAMTMRMLIEGYSDPVSAKRLGVSPRTYAAYVADLKDEFDAETRFQLGYTIGKLGLQADADAPES